MGKKSKRNKNQQIPPMPNPIRKQEENFLRELAENEVKKFSGDDVQANISFSSEQKPLAPLLTMAKTPLLEQIQTPFLPNPKAPSPHSLGLTQYQLQDLLYKYCCQIRENVKQGKPYNIEIQLDRGRQMSNRREFPLGNTLIKIKPMGVDEPKCFFIKAGDTLDASILLGGDLVSGIMRITDECGNDCYLRLFEFHLLSLRTEPDPCKEVALMTSFFWAAGKVCSGVIYSSSLEPIKLLLFSDWLQTRWQRSKDASTEFSDKEAGESNG